MFTAAGAALGAFAWDGGRVVELAWTEEQDLMLLESSGEVLSFKTYLHTVIPNNKLYRTKVIEKILF